MCQKVSHSCPYCPCQRFAWWAACGRYYDILAAHCDPRIPSEKRPAKPREQDCRCLEPEKLVKFSVGACPGLLCPGTVYCRRVKDMQSTLAPSKEVSSKDQYTQALQVVKRQSVRENCQRTPIGNEGAEGPEQAALTDNTEAMAKTMVIERNRKNAANKTTTQRRSVSPETTSRQVNPIRRTGARPTVVARATTRAAPAIRIGVRAVPRMTEVEPLQPDHFAQVSRRLQRDMNAQDDTRRVDFWDRTSRRGAANGKGSMEPLPAETVLDQIVSPRRNSITAAPNTEEEDSQSVSSKTTAAQNNDQLDAVKMVAPPPGLNIGQAKAVGAEAPPAFKNLGPFSSSHSGESVLASHDDDSATPHISPMESDETPPEASCGTEEDASFDPREFLRAEQE